MRIVGKYSRLLAILLAIVTQTCLAEDEFDKPPINYSSSEPDNAVSRLQKKIDDGTSELVRDGNQGFLKSLLAALNVPIDSQMLVFSKTSMQRNCICPETPRALYFSDDVYVGYCVGGRVLELSVADPQLGAVFYTIDQRANQKQPQFVRQTDNCLTCHSSSRTESVPGHLVRSVFADAEGQPIFSAGSFSVEHTTPLAQRWGGWYVTGTHGDQTHMGNRIYREQDVLRPGEASDGHNVTKLHERVSSSDYPSPHSDIVSLMVFEHQTLTHNRLARANFETRQALHYQSEMNRIFKEAADTPYESTTRRIQNVAERLVDALLFVDEAPLTAEISGTSNFADRFVHLGPRDSRGRSLRDFDLQSRLFKYPCSYLIYSASFDALPEEVKDCTWQRLWEIVTNKDQSKKYAHLSANDRKAIGEIIAATKQDVPTKWKAHFAH